MTVRSNVARTTTPAPKVPNSRRWGGDARQNRLVTIAGRPGQQLEVIEWLTGELTKRGIDYWLFGGWAVDFHAGRPTREHEDIDVAIWRADLAVVSALLEAHGWTHRPEPGEDGYTAYQRGDVRVELAFLSRDSAGVVYTELSAGRGEWPVGSFGGATADVHGIRVRVVGLEALIEDKSGPRQDPAVAGKDRGDVALLTGLTDSDPTP
jgi:hypothetical protein